MSPTPAKGTPQLAATHSVEQVRQIVKCRGTMYAVGTFSAIKWGGKTYSRHNAFSFSATSPFKITGWNPDVNGEVNSIALTSNCGHAYIGGSFTKAAGAAASNIGELRTNSNFLVKDWAHSANNTVNSIVRTGNGHLLVGGAFTSINGSGHSFYASLNPSTGRDDGYLNLKISGRYVYPGVHSNTTHVYNQQVSPDGKRVLVEGDFTSVGGQPRQQIFMLNLGSSATVAGWTSADFNQHCSVGHPFYAHAAAWSPDGNTVYVATTGRHLLTWNGKFPLTGPCDMVAAYSATTGARQWINYTGCYSLFSVAAHAGAVYIGGHERWANNQNGCKSRGSTGIPAPGMGGFTPGGSLITNSAGTAGLYSRARGLGADDMLATAAGLWIASDNFLNTNSCGGVAGHAGICFLPN